MKYKDYCKDNLEQPTGVPSIDDMDVELVELPKDKVIELFKEE